MVLPRSNPANWQPARLDNAQDPLAFFLDAIKQQLALDFWGDATKALTALNKRTRAGFDNQLLGLIGAYNNAVNNFKGQLISTQDYNMSLARSRAGLLDIIEQMPGRIKLNESLGNVTGDGAFNFKIVRSGTLDRPFDEQALEKVLPGHENLYKIAWLENALKNSRAVCRVVTPDDKGTGFLTENGYIFTNNHVIPDAATAGGTTVEFNFRTDMAGKEAAIVRYRLDASTFFTDEDLDYSYVRVIDAGEQPLEQWGFVTFDPDATVSRGDALTIIQHAGGHELQIGLDSNKTLSVWDQYVFYDTPTLGGSSGSPVFNQGWKVVALHHAGFEETVINAQGERRGANRGIFFRDIFNHLRQAGRPLPI